MPKAVIFDLNGVFIKVPKLTERLQRDFRVPVEESLPVLETVMGKVRLPKAGDVFQYWAPYLQKWGIPLSRNEFLDYWFREERPVPEMFALAREIKSLGISVFILSNNFSERTTYYHEHFPQLEEVADKIYFSWQTGFTKTYPQAYETLLNENNLKPQDCIFFDDSEKNIIVAQGLGIQSSIFTNVESVRAKIFP